MAKTVLRGLTWAHRRATDPLVASARLFSLAHPDLQIDWQVRSLQDFEHQPFAEAVGNADLIVFDHPYAGSIAADGLLLPMDEVLDVVPGGADPGSYVGRSLDSYRYAGRTWGVPVDGATINAMLRPDILDRLGQPPPLDWDGAIRLGERARAAGLAVLVAAHSHHALLTLMSLLASLGEPWTDDHVPTRPALLQAAGLFDRALEASDRTVSLASNAIAVHELMSTTDRYVYCPGAYGYATYGEAGAARLAFAPFPGIEGCHGTMLGGAAVGLTKRCTAPEEARAYLAYLAGGDAQLGFAAHSGQPARREAWDIATVDERFNGFFSATRGTIEAAVLRPRFAGYARSETRIARSLQAFLRGAARAERLADDFERIAHQRDAAAG